MRRQIQFLAILAGATGVAVVAVHFVISKNAAPAAPQILAPQNSPSIDKSVSTVTPDTINAIASPADRAATQLRKLLANDPTDQSGRAAELLNQQCREGKFQTALNLVDAVPRDMRPDWLAIVFNRWAQAQPTNAIQALDMISDPAERGGAFKAAVTGWNSSNPAGLANYAINLAESDERDYALTAALQNWSLQDPTALASWLNTLPHGSEFDAGAALMIAKTDGANRSPELAMKWVENIGNPQLKQTSFARVLSEWLQSDSAAARQYVANANWLDDSTRTKILGASQVATP
jgi:hypothetical protein